MNMLKRVLLVLILCALTGPVYANPTRGEVMNVRGRAYVTNTQQSRAPLKIGDFIQAQDIVETDADGRLDISFDKEWKNVARIEENAQMTVRSVVPASLELRQGGIYADLRSLPKRSVFKVTTPSAVASVRGTEFRTIHTLDQVMIYNYSNSPVEVYGRTSDGHLLKPATVLKARQKTTVPGVGAPPDPPQLMSPSDSEQGARMRAQIESKSGELIQAGYYGQIQSVREQEEQANLRLIFIIIGVCLAGIVITMVIASRSIKKGAKSKK